MIATISHSLPLNMATTIPWGPMVSPSDTPDAASPIDAARAAGLAARSALDPDERASATAAVVQRVLDLAELQSPGVRGVVAGSVSVQGEIDLSDALDALRARGWRIALPVVGGGDPGVMRFRIHRSGDPLVVGRFGIPVPAPGGLPELTAADLDVVIAPCVAVDEAGTRVGFGAGYYDRALADPTERPLVVVAAFEVQVVRDALAARPWDVAGDVVVTDRRTIRPSGTAGRRGRGPADGGCGGVPAR